MAGNITFPLSSSPGQHVQENAGRLINAYVEKLGDGGRCPTRHTRAPGLNTLGTVSGQSHMRGFLDSGAGLLAVQDNRISLISAGNTVTDLGVLSGTLPVTIVRNIRTPTPDIMAVTENGAFVLSTSGAPTGFTLAVGQPQPNSVTYLGGYGIFTAGNGRIDATDLNSTNVATNSNTTAAQRSDGLLRGIAFRGEFFAMGNSSIEVYSNAGTQPFPLAFRLMIPRGLAGTFAVAGWEEGWSNELIWVGDDNVVYQLVGYVPEPISTHDVMRAIELLPDRTTLEASVYMNAGHAIWVLSSPIWTWCYDLTTKQWHERQSYGTTRWRGSQSVRFNNQWIVGDRSSGKFFALQDTYQKEDVNPLVFEVWSVPLADFPSRLTVWRADFDYAVGVGNALGVDPIETKPQVEISWSGDGGANWTRPLFRQLGVQSQSRKAVSVKRPCVTGPKGIQCKHRISDPVHIGLMGGAMAVEERAP